MIRRFLRAVSRLGAARAAAAAAAAAAAVAARRIANHPERAADPDVGFRIAAWYWKTHDLNRLADAGDFTSITQRINGGQNGAASRVEYWERAKSVLG